VGLLVKRIISSLSYFKRMGAVSVDDFSVLMVKSYYPQSLQPKLDFMERSTGHLINHHSLHETLIIHLMTYDFEAD
jgi:hypothetical protein